jgi:hypothetical protein
VTQEADELAFRPKTKKGPFIITGVAAFVAGALLAAIVTAASMSSEAKGKRSRGAKRTRAATSASAAPSGSATVDGGAPMKKATGTLAARAIADDANAIKKLQGRPVSERTAEETLALVQVRNNKKRKEITELARKIELVPKLAREDKEVAAKLKDFSKDDAVAPDLLGAYADMKGSAGPDLLYSILRSLKKGDTADLAEELLYSKDVRKKASPALSVVLDLRKAEKCETVPKILERAKSDGDRRAIVPMIQFFNKRGCGEKKVDDCWPCLREGDLLKEAAAAVQKRAPPP